MLTYIQKATIAEELLNEQRILHTMFCCDLILDQMERVFVSPPDVDPNDLGTGA